MKTSYSQNSTYIDCPRYWELTYVEGYEAATQGSSLYFGTAIDRGVGEMLSNNPSWLKTFYDNWEFQAQNGNLTKIYDNDTITYSHKDFDGDVLEDKDFVELEKWAKELNLLDQNELIVTHEKLINLFKQASKAKSSPYIKITDEQFKYFNRCSWLSLKRKGKILLEAFEKQVKPKIKNVISLQKRCKIEDPATGDQIIGYIDMVLELDGYDKPIIFDLKTSAFPYDQGQLDLSPQLTLYSAMESRNYNTDLVGYIVLPKNIQKDEVSHCAKCNVLRNTRHQTCNVTLADGSRCKGSWLMTKVPNPQVQIMVASKTPEQVNDLLLDIGNIVLAMKNRIVYRNTSKCENWYGGRCPMYDACHKKDYSKLVKKK